MLLWAQPDLPSFCVYMPIPPYAAPAYGKRPGEGPSLAFLVGLVFTWQPLYHLLTSVRELAWQIPHSPNLPTPQVQFNISSMIITNRDGKCMVWLLFKTTTSICIFSGLKDHSQHRVWPVAWNALFDQNFSFSMFVEIQHEELNSFTNSALDGGKAMNVLASERAFDILGNHCPKASGRQIKCHEWNSRLPGDEFCCWGGRKEQSHCEAFLARSGMRWKSAQGGPLQKSDCHFRALGTDRLGWPGPH